MVTAELLDRAENWEYYVDCHGENWWSIAEAFAIVKELLNSQEDE